MSIDCVTIGDTIAFNLQGPLHCIEGRASPNLTSSRVIDMANGSNGAFHQVCIISAGSYDYSQSKKTYDNLNQIRNIATCKFYVWVKPISNPAAATDVNSIASRNDDIEATIGASSDGITPSSYNDLAAEITNELNAKGL